MASMGFLASSSHLSAQSHVQLRTNSKYFYPPSSWIPSPSSKAYYKHLSYNLESSKSSFIQSDGFSFSLPKISTSSLATSSIFSPHSNVITAQRSGLGDENTIYQFEAKEKGRTIHFNKYRENKAKVLLIVNIPEESFEDARSEIDYLNDLHDKYNKDGLEILGFLYDQKETTKSKDDQTKSGHRWHFSWDNSWHLSWHFLVRKPTYQEMEGDKEKIDIKFNIFDKVTLNGENADEVWKFLKSSGGGDIKDEFTMFLIDKWGFCQGSPLRFPKRQTQQPPPGGEQGGGKAPVPGGGKPEGAEAPIPGGGKPDGGTLPLSLEDQIQKLLKQ